MYGAEYLADPKIQRLTAAERSCWVTLLCAASLNNGIVQHMEEEYLLSHSGIDPLSPEWSKTHGILVKLEMLGMISKGRDNAGLELIVIKNWDKRQTSGPKTGYERLKKWRESKRLKAGDNNDNVDANGKNRIEENRIEESYRISAKSEPSRLDSPQGTEEDYMYGKLDEDGRELNPKPEKPKSDKESEAFKKFIKQFQDTCVEKGLPRPLVAGWMRKQVWKDFKESRLTQRQAADLMEDWFAGDRKDVEMINVSFAFGARNINDYKARNNVT